jgi:hypothetical protein
LAAFDDFTATLTGRSQRIHAVSASGNFFESGVQAQIGRALTADDDRPDAAEAPCWPTASGTALWRFADASEGHHPQRHAARSSGVPRSFDMQMVAGGEVDDG